VNDIGVISPNLFKSSHWMHEYAAGRTLELSRKICDRNIRFFQRRRGDYEGLDSCFSSTYSRSLETSAKYSKIPGYRLNFFSLTKMLLTTAKKTMPTINANPLITACP
jgi:hypothetical protein